MKSPPKQIVDDEAHDLTEQFIKDNRLKKKSKEQEPAKA
jgi:hypothetical protein